MRVANAYLDAMDNTVRASTYHALSHDVSLARAWVKHAHVICKLHAQEWEKVEIHNMSGNGLRIPIYMHVRRGVRALQTLMSDAFPGSLHSDSGACNAPQVPFWLCSTRSHQPAAWGCMLGGQDYL